MTATVPALSTKYEPQTAEAKWQAHWETDQVFKADPTAAGEPYCVMIPPPNVTGSLHMGHAFDHALIDTLVRYHRMAGKNTLWLPGTDHASIAVQAILDRQLKEEGTDRFAIGREAFLQRAMRWKQESGGTIVGQMRRMGLSVDWSRERFTMDEGLSNAVLEAFVRLHSDGLIYRGKYMVNWCPASQSAVSDLEVENREVDGHLWQFRYPLTDGSGSVVVATTRPETMLGDTAVAVNPTDERYRHLIGKTLTLPLVGREIPIIGDEFVDPAFGTGCVKVTPAHDPNDFEMGKRHNLPQIEILNKDGTLNDMGGEFAGLDRFVARKQLVARMEELGCLEKVEPYRHSVPYSDRGKVPVEPLLSSQWFVKIAPLAQAAIAALENNHDPAFVPERWTKVYRDWLLNLRDWCVSRQLWWGHQIPAWYVVSETGGTVTDHTPYVVARNEDDARRQAIAQYGDGAVLERDPDVLDTWFSSGLWPFSTLGWPEATADLERYYPNTILVTGFDIIFFWVARMTMMGGYFTGKMPFNTVYIHGLVRDENNQKMSKSKGNGIDPLLLADKYGADALRYTLIREVAGAGQDIRLDYDRESDESAAVEASRNFANKLWNAARFVMMNLEGQTPDQLGNPLGAADLETADRWILSRHHQTVRTSRDYLEQHGLGEAAKGLYEFIWGDFCDWYIELVKPRLNGEDGPSKTAAQRTLAHVLDGILKLLHPFMPHVTEEVWHGLVGDPDNQRKQYLALQPYPVADEAAIAPELEEQFDLIFGAVRTIRNLRAEADIKPGLKVPIVFKSESEREREILTASRSYICTLAKVESLTVLGADVAPEAKLSEAAPTARPTPVQPAIVPPDPESAADASADTPPIPLPTPEQQRVILLLGLLGFTGLVLLKIATGVLDVVDDFPLLPEFFELVGLGYSAWFVVNHLLFADDRAALADTLAKTKQITLGDTNPFLALTETARSPLELPAPTAAILEPLAAIALDPEPVPVEAERDRAMASGVVGTVQVLMPLDGLVDLDALRTKLEKNLSKLEADIKSLGGRLGNAKFVDKAPPEVVQGVRDALAEADAQAAILRDRLAQLR
ncbi:MAG: valine--tRNA ligase [Cyanophyceae cyanobacterium]